MNTPVAPRTVIQASAGTGKTYRLSIRILRLLALGQAPATITALTFTRAAAAEFLTKVIERLTEVCSSDARHAEICADAGLDPKAHSREAFAKLLAGVLVDSDRLTLGTLDSFFARLVNAFPMEVGIETGTASIIEAHAAEELVAEVATSLLGSKDEAGLMDFSEKLRQLAGGKAQATPTRSLIEAADTLHDAYLSQTEASAWGVPDTIWGKTAKPRWIGAANIESLKEDIRTLAQRATQDYGKLPAEIRDAAAAMQEGKPGGALSKLVDFFDARLDDAVAGRIAAVKFGTKNGLADSEDAQLVQRIFEGLAGAVVNERLEQTQAAHGCLSEYESTYDADARRRGRLTFSDYVRLLNERLLGRELSLIHYRMDAKVRHWLLDEFQDTSTEQLEALYPYLNEMLSKQEADQSLFVVGDPKQSLYEWRKGNRKLLGTVQQRLENLAAKLPEDIRRNWIEVLPLNKTRRCAKPVLGLTNRILDNVERDHLGSDFPEEAHAAWRVCYATQEAHVEPGKKAKPGEAIWVRFPRQKSNSRKGPSIVAQARWIAWHLRNTKDAIDKNGRLRDGLTCAILVRSNADAQMFAECLKSLDATARIDANDETAVSPTTDNPVTAPLLQVIKAAAHPHDEMAKGMAEMSQAARAYVQSKGGWDSAIAHACDLFHREGAEALVHDLCQSVTSGHLKGDNGFAKGRLALLRRLAETYDQGDERRLAGLIEHLEGKTTRGVADRGAVQVITIHRSKGLEYDMVYMPMPDDGPTMAGIDDTDILAVYPSPGSSQENLDCFKPAWLCLGFSDAHGRVLDTLDPDCLGKARRNSMTERGYGALCRLYVGMTRARHRLVLMSDELSTQKDGPKTRRLQINDLIHRKVGDTSTGQSLGPDAEATAQVMYADESNDPSWIDTRLAELTKKKSEVKVADPKAGVALQPEILFRRPKRNNPSHQDHAYVQPAQTEDLAKPVGGKGLGNRVHDLLAHLEWDIPSFLSWMEAQKSPVALRPIDQAAKQFIGITLGDAEVAKALAQNSDSEVLWIERKVATFRQAEGAETKDEVTVGSFDRVHVIAGERALIIDYKTARADKSPNSIKETYTKQMAAYRQSLHAMTGIPLESISCKLIVVREKPCVIEIF